MLVAVINLHDQELPSQLENVAKIHKISQQMRAVIESMTINARGKVVGEIGGKVVIELPLESVEDLKALHKRLTEEFGQKIEIGVGEDSYEANLASDYAQEKHPGKIKLYHPEMENEMAKETTQVAIGPDDIKKSEQPISESQKAQILQALEQVQQNQETLERFKQDMPETYEAMTDVVMALNHILQANKEVEQKFLNDTVQKISAHLTKEHGNALESHGQKIDKHLGKFSKPYNAQKKAESMAKLKEHQKVRKALMKEAQKEAKQTGMNPLFLFHLKRTFK